MMVVPCSAVSGCFCCSPSPLRQKQPETAGQTRKPRRVSGCEWQRGTCQTAFDSRFGAMPAQSRSNRPSPGTGVHPTKAEGEKQLAKAEHAVTGERSRWKDVFGLRD